MKVFGITMLFVALGLSGMIYTQRYIKNTLQGVLESMEIVEASIYDENPVAAEEAYTACCEKYMHMLNRVTLFINHTDLTDARVVLGHLGVCIRDRQWHAARASFAEAKVMLMDVAEQERVELKNIF